MGARHKGRSGLRFVCLLAKAAALLAMNSCDETILHELDESKANRVLVALEKAGIDSEKVREGSNWSISVDSARSGEALTALAGSRVLDDRRRALPQSTGMVASREERLHFLERSVALQLEQTLEQLPGVLEARVHLYVDPAIGIGLHSPAPRHSASALLVVGEGPAIDSRQVRALIGGASGVKAEAINVVVAPDQPEKSIRPEKSARPTGTTGARQKTAAAVSQQTASGPRLHYRTVLPLVAACAAVSLGFFCVLSSRTRRHRSALLRPAVPGEESVP